MTQRKQANSTSWKKGEAVEKFGLEKNGLNLEANKKLKDEREKEREKGVWKDVWKDVVTWKQH